MTNTTEFKCHLCNSSCINLISWTELKTSDNIESITSGKFIISKCTECKAINNNFIPLHKIQRKPISA